MSALTGTTREKIGASRDGFDLVTEIDQLQRRLEELDKEQQEVLIGLRDAKYHWLVADTKVRAVHGEVDIAKARLIALQSMLKAIPK